MSALLRKGMITVIQEDPQEKARRLGVPLLGKKKNPFPAQIPYDPNPIVGICAQCGREIHHVEGYYCPDINCPLQPKVT